MKRHHKWIIGSASTTLLVYIIVSGILLNGVIVKQQLDHKELLKEINDLQSSQTETQSNLGELTENLIFTQKSIDTLDESLS